MNDTDTHRLTRRGALSLAAGAFSIALVAPARARPEAMKEVMDAFTGGKPATEGRVKFEISLLVENGNSVPLSVNVESPMTAQDRVTRIGVFNEKNPLPDVAIFTLTERSGRAQVATRMRLNDSQMVTAVAEMSDGTYWSGTSEVIVTLPACVEG